MTDTERERATPGAARTTHEASVGRGTAGGLDTRMVFVVSAFIAALGALGVVVWALLYAG